MAYLDNIAVFVRVVELGSLSAAGRDMRLSPAVASNRIKELEKGLGVRLLNRTTRQLALTEHGTAFYDGAKKVLDAVAEAEAAVSAISQSPRGVIRVTAPLGIGRRLIAPVLPLFHERFPEITVRLRLSDHNVDLMKEGIDLAFRLGVIEDSSFRMRVIAPCERVLAASPTYLAARGTPDSPDALRGHACLLLRFPGSREFAWTLQTPEGPRKLDVHGPFDSDDGDVLTDWAVAGHGIVMKPRFEIAQHLAAGRLALLLPETPPLPAQLAAIYPHKMWQDPKLRLLLDFAAEHCARAIREQLERQA